MPKFDKGLCKSAKMFREQKYQELFEGTAGAKSFVYARRGLLWSLRALYLANLACAVAAMAQIKDFSQLAGEIIRFLIGIFFFYIAGRSFQGAICLWFLVLINLLQIGRYIGALDIVLNPAYWTEAPVVVAMYCVQLLFLAVLAVTAVYLCLPSSRRHAEEVLEVEKAYVQMLTDGTSGPR